MRGSTARKALELVMVLGVVSTLIILLYPQVESREADPRTQCANNLKQIGIALLNYQDIHKRFPPVAILGKGREKLHSWRVLILPYAEQKNLFEAYDFEEKWNGQKNRQLHSIKLDFFECPETAQEDCSTSYLAITGIQSPWTGIQSPDLVVPVVIESALPGPIWCEPKDVDAMTLLQQLRTGLFPDSHYQGINVLFSDGSVDFMEPRKLMDMLESLRKQTGGLKPF